MPKGSEAALWILAFNTGVWRGDVLTSYEFALVQFTRFRPVRRRAGGVRFARLRRKAKHRLFATRFAVASTASTGLLPTAPTAAKTLARKESPTFCESESRVVAGVQTFPPQRSRHEGVGISGAPPLIKIRAEHQCEFVWY